MLVYGGLLGVGQGGFRAGLGWVYSWFRLWLSLGGLRFRVA